jgi:hypothetical protein
LAVKHSVLWPDEETMMSFIRIAFAITWLSTESLAQTTTPLALDSVWARNYALNDTATAALLMADDFVALSSNGSLKDKAAEMGDIRPTPGLTMKYFRTTGARVIPVGASGAAIVGSAEWSFEQNGRPATITRGYVAVYMRGGPLGWQLKALRMGSPPSTQNPSLRGEIETLTAAMVADFKRDPASVAQHYGDRARIVGGGMSAVGRVAVDAYWKGITGPSDWSLAVADVGGDRNTPWVLGRSTLIRNGRRSETEFIGLLERGADGKLRFVADLYAPASAR